MLNNEKIFQMLSSELSISTKQIQNVIALLEDGNTVPFIARYRKEQTGALNEVEIRNISERWQYIQNLEKRKEEVIRLIEEQGKLTESLRNEILAAEKLQQVEDLYRPYRQKRRTKATIAKERGLEPLAKWIYSLPLAGSIEEEAEKYINEEKEIHTVEDALSGAKDIIAEWISDDPNFRQWIREQTLKEGMVVSTCKDEEKDEKKVFEMYYQYEEPIKKIVPHRVLALNRGEKEGILRVAIEPPTEQIVAYLKKKLFRIKGQLLLIFYLKRWRMRIDGSYSLRLSGRLEKN